MAIEQCTTCGGSGKVDTTDYMKVNCGRCRHTLTKMHQEPCSECNRIEAETGRKFSKFEER